MALNAQYVSLQVSIEWPFSESDVELVDGGEDAGGHVGDSTDFDRLDRVESFFL